MINLLEEMNKIASNFFISAASYLKGSEMTREEFNVLKVLLPMHLQIQLGNFVSLPYSISEPFLIDSSLCEVISINQIYSF